jgi:ABC-type lipoprotein release transport system permease subunit
MSLMRTNFNKSYKYPPTIFFALFGIQILAAYTILNMISIAVYIEKLEVAILNSITLYNRVWLIVITLLIISIAFVCIGWLLSLTWYIKQQKFVDQIVAYECGFDKRGEADKPFSIDIS